MDQISDLNLTSEYDHLALKKDLNYLFYPYDTCLLYTSDAADERSSVDLGGRRIIKKKNKTHNKYMIHHLIKQTNNKPYQ